MAESAPDYYVSSLASSGVGDGTLGNPYALTDLNIAGGSYKTLATEDIVAIIDDGTYSMAANLAVQGGSAGVQYGMLRGCKIDGTWDHTGSTKPRIEFDSGYTVIPNNVYWLVADMTLATKGPQNGIYCSTYGDYGLMYNIDIVKMGTGVGGRGVYWVVGNTGTIAVGVRVYSDDVVNAYWTTGFFTEKDDGQMIYCVARGFEEFGFAQSGANDVALVNCLAYSPRPASTVSVGFESGLRNNFIHCTADGMAVDGFSLAGTNEKVLGCVATNNGAYGFRVGAAGWPVGLMSCAGFNNVLGNDNGGDWGIGVMDTVDPGYVGGADYTPTASGLPSLSALISGAAGGNIAGALSPGVSS